MIRERKWMDGWMNGKQHLVLSLNKKKWNKINISTTFFPYI